MPVEFEYFSSSSSCALKGYMYLFKKKQPTLAQNIERMFGNIF